MNSAIHAMAVAEPPCIDKISRRETERGFADHSS